MAPLAFDASTFEIWGALLHGARLVLYPGGAIDVSELRETLKRHSVTTALADRRALPSGGRHGCRCPARPPAAARRGRRALTRSRLPCDAGGAGTEAHQRLRADGGDDVLLLLRRDLGRPVRRIGPDRASDRERFRLRARPGARADAGRRSGRALHRRRRRCPRLPEPAGARLPSVSYRTRSATGASTGPEISSAGATTATWSSSGARTGR